MKYSRTLLSLIIAGVLSTTIAQANASVENCSGETMPNLNKGMYTCSIDVDIHPNEGSDVSEKVLHALSEGKSLFFPAGSYHVSRDIILNKHNSLAGSTSGVTIIHGSNPDGAVSIGNKNYDTPVDELTIKNIIFDNATINFYGNKKNIEIRNNAFINTDSKKEQLSVSHHPFVIHGNVFLRDKNHPGLGISTYRNSKTKIENNVIGDITDKNVLLTLNYYDAGTFNVISKIKASSKNKVLNVLEEQGYFISGWYATDGLKNSVFRNNVISGSTLDCLDTNGETEKSKCTMTRDHAIYIKQYNSVDVINNYFSGWPLDANGQLKFRNASHLYFAGNYLNTIEFNARPYSGNPILKMDNTFIFNNVVEEGKIGYWQNFTDTDEQYINAENFAVFDNLFIAEDQQEKRVQGTWRSTHGDFLETNNHYADQTSVLTQEFNLTDIQTIKQRLPDNKKSLLTIKPIPLLKKIGNISGPDLKEGQLVRLDIQTEGYPDQFVVYSPETQYHYPSYRWASELTNLFNQKIKGACAGVLVTEVKDDSEFAKKSCNFMTSKGSSYLNDIYKTEGGTATYSTKIIDKLRQVGAISGTKMILGQTVKFKVTFEDGTQKEVAYTPDDEYRTAGHRWPTELAHKINVSIPGLCVGQPTSLNAEKNGVLKCGNVKPIGSSYLNKIFTINGQSAQINVSIDNE